jgi:TetR/AcrR family transcriptional regulator
MLLQFAEKNPGMVRVMVGDALVFENDRLQQRMNQFFDKIESTFRQCFRDAALVSTSATPTADAQVRAACWAPLSQGACSALHARVTSACHPSTWTPACAC